MSSKFSGPSYVANLARDVLQPDCVSHGSRDLAKLHPKACCPLLPANGVDVVRTACAIAVTSASIRDSRLRRDSHFFWTRRTT